MIALKEKDEDQYVEISIIENGIGSDMKNALKIFDVFTRSDRDDEYEWSGIGIANVNRVIHTHHGTIRVEGVTDQGATFIFTRPESKEVSRNLA